MRGILLCEHNKFFQSKTRPCLAVNFKGTMSLFSVDATGTRIRTDILVSGYIRDIGKEYKLLIPKDINGICLKYWLIKICDEWDKEFSSENITIDGQKAQCKKQALTSAYGCQSVNKGSYSWKIKFNTQVTWICIGVKHDDSAILHEFENRNSYDDYGYGCLLYTNGGFWSEGSDYHYCDGFRDKDTMITMTLNMDKHTICYKINDKDLGPAQYKLDKEKYRMVVNLYDPDNIVELL